MQIPILYAFLCFSLLSTTRSDDLICGKPPAIEFASTTPTAAKSPVGTTVTYTCEFGYITNGRIKESRCELNENNEKAEWTVPQMTCLPRSCGDPGYVTNGHRVGSLFSFPNAVTFECEEGFRMIGNAVRYCSATGTWSGSLPRCQIVSCQSPVSPEHGHVTYSSVEFGSELKFNCNPGYHLSNLEPVVCTADGTWKPAGIACVERSCKLPEKPEHGFMEFISSSDVPHTGTIVIFSCEEGRSIHGPSTSKCLDIGEWTFPTPQCLEPCKLPSVPHGKIGRYVRKGYRRILHFEQIPVGNKIEDDEKLFLHCDSGYSPLGSTNWQEKVTCSKGKWSEDPYCEPSACNSEPPKPENGRIESYYSNHGSTVFYECLQDFEKIKSGNVSCQFGHWKGIMPICKDTRCYVDQMNFSGLENSRRDIYYDGEEMRVTCKDRYQLVSKSNGRLVCDRGSWVGAVPPCVAASCSDRPRSIDNGRVEVTSRVHGSFARYICDKHYVPEGTNSVQCLFGEWSGRPPKCKDGRCYMKDLKFSRGFLLDLHDVTNSGDELRIRCDEGYVSSAFPPRCNNGVWTGNTGSICREEDCMVRWIPNGVIKEKKIGPKTWSWWYFKYIRKETNREVPLNTIPSRAATLFLECFNGYSVQGKSWLKSTKIVCSQGRWSPDAVCLQNGKKYVPTTRAPQVTRPAQISSSTQMKSTTSRPQFHITTTLKEKLKPSVAYSEKTESAEVKPTEAPTEFSTEKVACFCEYLLNDTNVVAYMDRKEVKFYDKVQAGSIVKFRCKDVGFHHFMGRREISCESCKPWHSGDFPTCVDPKSGDAVILYENAEVLLDGALETQKGQTVELMCVAMEKAEYPTWIAPHQREINAVTMLKERRDDFLYTSYILIENATSEDEGLYECAVGDHRPTVIELRVSDPNKRCPKFADDEALNIAYDLDTVIGSQATFSCRMRNHELNGTKVSTCLRNGEWSSPPPQCTEIKCRKLKDTDLMQIQYTENRKIGSFAIFHCFAPGRQTGVSRSRCMENGQWADPVPQCRTDPCTTESLFSQMPQGVMPDMSDVSNDTMPYNSTIKLVCEGNLQMVGKPVAKCGREGSWEIESSQCISGCILPVITPESKVVMDVQKDVYRLGESIIFSCPPGLELNTQVQKIMCLITGWSENNLPQCVEY